MTKTYAEQFQAALFTAAAETYDVASRVLDECTEYAEFTGATYEWAREKAKSYAQAAQALKDQAVALTPVVRAPVKYNRAQRRYSVAVDRHLELRVRALEGSFGEGNA